MKKFALFLLVATLALVGMPHGISRAADNTITITLNAQNNSGESGTATLTDLGNGQTKVVLDLGAGLADPQPAHIHPGTCANLNPKPEYPLTNVVNGKSETIVKVSLADLTKEAYAINVHKSAAEVAVYTACGDIKAMAMPGGTSGGAMNTTTVTLNAQNNSGESGTATLTDLGNGQVKVVLDLGAGLADPQPAHIHPGTCANLDPKPQYPLTNVVNGKSETIVNVSMADLTKTPHAINVHKSAAEVAVYTACGDIQAMTMPGGTTSGGTSGGTTSGGSTMPATGNGSEPLFLLGLALLATLLLGAGLRLARKRA